MRLSLLMLAIFGLFAFSGMPHAIEAASCADGTPYGKCSTKNPGQYCTGSIYAPTLGTLLSVCPCSKFLGYVQQGEGETATCILAKCTDGTEAGKCSATKPKQCVNGALVDNATACGCPSGKRPSANGLACEFIPCNDSGTPVPEGTCSPRKEKKCVNGILVSKASECGCPPGKTKMGEACGVVCSDGTEDGKCSPAKPKKCVNGYLLDDAPACGCPDGQVAVGKQCSASAAGELGGVEMLSGGNTSSSGSGAPASNALSCCCLPTALIGIAGGYAFFRKKN